MHRIPIDGFELREIVGRGGMGVVWRAEHASSAQSVAVKVMSAPSTRQKEYLARFRHEVRAVARMSHPGILDVYDLGEIPDGAIGPDLAAGSPYLVMELGERGTLRSRCGVLPWAEARDALLGLLDGLAHAHANGVVHRDLKPSNVLWGDDAGDVRLTDFGLAVAGVEGADDMFAQAGTPAYMAPEQFDGRWRDYGPWTDLYQLGCLAWELVTGDPPFGWPTWVDARKLHAEKRPLPEPEPRVPVPHALRGWLGWLMARDLAQRCRWAADAAHALRGMAGADAPAVVAMRSVWSDDETTEGRTQLVADDPTGAAALATDLGTTEPITLIEMMAPPVSEVDSAPVEIDAGPAAPVPRSWRRRWLRRRPPGSTGLGLYKLKDPPFVGREVERDALWEALSEVHASGLPRAIVLTGPSGVGKSRLAHWLGVQAHQAGVARVFKALHSPIGGALDGLGPMIVRDLAGQRLSLRGLRKRLRDVLARHEVDDVSTAALAGWLTGSGPELALGEQHALVRRYLAGRCGARVGVVWVEDAQWGPNAVRAARASLTAGAPPLLFVITAADEAVAQEPAARAALDRLLEHDRAEALALGPLDGEARMALIAGLLDLEAPLAARVDERAGGNPLFAVQLVEDWVQRGMLEPGEDGYRLRTGEADALPEDLSAAWDERLARLVGDRAALGLEIAAVLGQDVDPDEWSAVCGLARVDPSDELVEALLAQRLIVALAEGPDHGWSFAHGMFREAVLRRAGQQGRLRDHHAACARHLSARPDVDERLARHLLAAGRDEDALEPLLQAIDKCSRVGAYGTAEVLLGERDQALDRLGASQHDPRRVRGSVEMALVQFNQGHARRSLDLALQAESLARASGDPALLVRALEVESTSASRAGEPALALRAVDEAREIARAHGMDHALILLDIEHGSQLLDRGDHQDAVALLEPLVDRDDLTARARWGVLDVLARAALQRGDGETCSHFAFRMLAVAEATARRPVQAHAHSLLGEGERLAGRLDEAERHYVRAIELSHLLGTEHAAIHEVNLALVRIARGDLRAARRTLQRLVPDAERRGDKAVLTVGHVLLARVAAQDQDWDEFGYRFDLALELLSLGYARYPDVAEALEESARLAWSDGRVDEASDAYGAARTAWSALDRDERVAAIDEAMDAIS